MGTKPVTVKDIANHLGVSLSTVNKALTGKSGISEKKRAEIVKTAREMGYRVNHVAQSLSRKPIRIGVVLPGLWQSFWQEAYDGMCDELARLSPYHVTGELRFAQTSAETEKIIDAFVEAEMDALVVCVAGFQFSRDLCSRVNASQIPVFLSGSNYAMFHAESVISIDGRMAGNMAADIFHLAVPEQGKVAVFTGFKDVPIHAEKINAFQSAVKHNHLEVVEIFETHDQDEVVQACLMKLMHEHEKIDGIYLASASGSGIFEYFRQTPPGEIPLIVATDLYPDVRRAVHDGIVAATIYQNQKLMGALTIRTAYEYLLGSNSYSDQPYRCARMVNVTPQILLRSSLSEACMGDYTTVCYSDGTR